MNKKLGSNLKAVFSTTKKYNLSTGLDWAGDDMILINHKNEIVLIGNSEWAYIQ